MDKIAQLCAAEQKYIEKLQLVVHTYGQLVYEAADPEIESFLPIEDFPSLLNQHRQIFKFYEEMLEVHSDLFAFWTHNLEDYLDVDRCGQLFYHGLIEERFDVYLNHIVGNPLRHSTVQEDFTKFIELAVDNEDLLLLTGYECFRFPMDHLKFYERVFSDLLNTGRSLLSVINASNLMDKLLKRIEKASKFAEIRNCDVFLPLLGTYLMSADFIVRDYKEGQQHKAELFLFDKGVLLAKQKGLSFFRRESELEYDSYYSLDQIELSLDNCFRLKDEVTKLTVYKVIEKRRETKCMIEFMKKIKEKKRIFEMEIVRSGNDLNQDLGDQEAINLDVLRRHLGKREIRGLGVEMFKVDHTVRTSVNTCVSFVEAFNVKLCQKIVLRRNTRDSENQERYRRSIRDKWRRVSWKAVHYYVEYL